MTAVSGKEFARVLEQHGWRLLRISGSQHVYSKRGIASRISIPVHGNAALKRGLWRHFLKVPASRKTILSTVDVRPRAYARRGRFTTVDRSGRTRRRW